MTVDPSPLQMESTPQRVQWLEADPSTWLPDEPSNLVTTFYADPVIPQLEFYERIDEWVAPGGTLLIVGYDHDHGDHHHGDHHHGNHEPGDGGGVHPPVETTAAVSSVIARLDIATWDVVTAERHHRTLANGSGGTVELYDIVVRATRRHRRR